MFAAYQTSNLEGKIIIQIKKADEKNTCQAALQLNMPAA